MSDKSNKPEEKTAPSHKCPLCGESKFTLGYINSSPGLGGFIPDEPNTRLSIFRNISAPVEAWACDNCGYIIFIALRKN